MIGCLLCGDAPADRSATASIEIETVRVPCPTLDETRRLHVSLPPGYASSSRRYPVLFCMVGAGTTGISYASGLSEYLTELRLAEPMIVICIDDIDGRRDLTPTRAEAYGPTSGGADDFIRCIRQDIIPFVDERYRTRPCRMLWAHSIAGAFALHCTLTAPEVFEVAIVSSPWLIYDGEERFLLKSAEEALAGRSEERNFLFTAVGDEPNLAPSIEEFAAVLAKASPKGLQWTLRTWEEENHATIMPRCLLEGLRAYFAHRAAGKGS